MTHECERIDALAGAIALGEASDSERDAYRRHIAGCARCIDALGGEREIERVAQMVALVREQESWEPDVRAALRARSRPKRHAWQFGAAAVAAAAIVFTGATALFAGHSDRDAMGARQLAASRERAIAAVRTVGIAPVPEERAESLTIAPAGDVTFELRVDSRGMPTKCVVTKSSGYAVRDRAVCRAAMRSRYDANR